MLRFKIDLDLNGKIPEHMHARVTGDPLHLKRIQKQEWFALIYYHANHDVMEIKQKMIRAIGHHYSISSIIT